MNAINVIIQITKLKHGSGRATHCHDHGDTPRVQVIRSALKVPHSQSAFTSGSVFWWCNGTSLICRSKEGWKEGRVGGVYTTLIPTVQQGSCCEGPNCSSNATPRHSTPTGQVAMSLTARQDIHDKNCTLKSKEHAWSRSQPPILGFQGTVLAVQHLGELLSSGQQ